MKKRNLILLTIALLAATTARAELGTSIQLQQDQILGDVQSGALKPSQAQVLLQRLDRIKFELKRAKSDGHVNPYETQMITKMLDQNAAALQLAKQKR